MNAVYSPNGRLLASSSVKGSNDYTIKIWDAERDQDRIVVEREFGHYIAISPDGKYVAGGSGLDLILWDARTGQVAQTLKGHKVPVMGVAFSPDGKRIVSGGSGRPSGSGGWIGTKIDPAEVKIWDAQMYKEILSITDKPEPNQTGPGTGRSVFGVAFSPDGKRVASARKVWDAQTGERLLTLPSLGGWGPGVAFSPDGKYIAAGRGDSNGDKESREVRLFDAQTGQELRTFSGGGIGVAFSPDSKRLASAATQPDAKVWMWDVETGREIFAAKGGGYGVAISYDGKRVASGSKVWNAENGEELLSLRLEGSGYGIAFSPEGRRLASAEWTRVTIFDATPLPEKP
jgi:WD40 repeat protein